MLLFACLNNLTYSIPESDFVVSYRRIRLNSFDEMINTRKAKTNFFGVSKTHVQSLQRLLESYQKVSNSRRVILRGVLLRCFKHSIDPFPTKFNVLICVRVLFDRIPRAFNYRLTTTHEFIHSCKNKKKRITCQRVRRASITVSVRNSLPE